MAEAFYVAHSTPETLNMQNPSQKCPFFIVDLELSAFKPFNGVTKFSLNDQ